MKAQDLKKSILQYAMQGKLVMQDPTDEPASELLKRIKAEKEQLIKDGKIKKGKQLPPITQDKIPYELPQGWEWVSLGNIIKISSGNFLPAEKMNQSGNIPVYGGNGINGYHNEYIIDKPTLIIGRVGFYCGCVHLSKGKAWVTDNAFITHFSEKNIDINFLKWLLISSDLGKNDNATAQPVVSGKKIYPLIVSLPPFAEQKRIVEKLEEILPLVEEYGKNEDILSEMNQKLPKQIRQSILQYAVQGKLVEQDPTDEPASELLKRIRAEKEQLIKDGKIKKEKPLPPITQDEIPYELPQGWEWCYLNNITTQIHYGYTASAIQRGEVKLVRITDIQYDQIKWDNVPYCDISEENKNKYLLQNNDILIARTGGTIGKTYLVKNIKAPAVFASYLIRTIPSLYINSEYLKLFMGSPLYWEQLKNFSMGTGQPNVNGQSLSKLKIPLPPLAEQKRIVVKVEELIQLVDKLEKNGKIYE